jgi:hypothetical protein
MVCFRQAYQNLTVSQGEKITDNLSLLHLMTARPPTLEAHQEQT